MSPAMDQGTPCHLRRLAEGSAREVAAVPGFQSKRRPAVAFFACGEERSAWSKRRFCLSVAQWQRLIIQSTAVQPIRHAFRLNTITDRITPFCRLPFLPFIFCCSWFASLNSDFCKHVIWGSDGMREYCRPKTKLPSSRHGRYHCCIASTRFRATVLSGLRIEIWAGPEQSTSVQQLRIRDAGTRSPSCQSGSPFDSAIACEWYQNQTSAKRRDAAAEGLLCGPAEAIRRVCAIFCR